MTETENLARTIAALLQSSVVDTPLAMAVGAEPTDVDYEIAEALIEAGWTRTDAS